MRWWNKALVWSIACAGCLAAGVARAADVGEEALLATLKSDASAADKIAACWKLKLAGTERAVPLLEALLPDKDVSHAARYALETMPYPSAGAALRNAMGKSDGLVKVGIINSIGQRRDAEAMAALAAALKDADPQVVGSTAVALGRIGGSEAARALTTARPTVPEKAKAAFDDGYLLAADSLLRSGKADEATAIYQSLCKCDGARAAGLAALQGVFIAAGDKRYDLVVQYLGAADADARQIAAGQIANLSDAQIKSLAAGAAKLPAAAQASILALADICGDRSLLPVAIEAAKSPNAELRAAAVKTLGRLGDASLMPALIQQMFADEKTAASARAALEAVGGKGSDEKIVEAMQAEKDPRRRAEIVDVLDARKAVAAVPALLIEARGDDAVMRGHAMTALGRLAEPDAVPGMVQGVFKAEKGLERDNAEKAVMLVCQKIAEADRRIDAVLAAAGSDEARRAAVLPIIGRIGGAKAMDLIQTALASKDAEVYTSGVRAISNWPNAEVAEALLKLAQTAEKPEHRAWALHGLVRVISQPGRATDAHKLAVLRQAMQMATCDEERNWVLQRSGAVRNVETLRFVAPYLDKPSLAEEACHAVVELAHHKELRRPNKAEFDAALEKVLKTSHDADTQELAKRYLQQIL